jgi:hypothetical protein
MLEHTLKPQKSTQVPITHTKYRRELLEVYPWYDSCTRRDPLEINVTKRFQSCYKGSRGTRRSRVCSSNSKSIINISYEQEYGGSQDESEEAILATAEGAFNIATSKEEAKKQIQILENAAENAASGTNSTPATGNKKDLDPLSGLGSFKDETSFKPQVYDLMGEDGELISKKQAADAERAAILRQKAKDEQVKKAEMQKKGSKEFNAWMEYIE